jgi:colanic acid biosynthesis glycosyl transferase WcaI
MNILIVSHYFWPENFYINNLARGLHDRGHQVTVLAGIPNYPGGKFYPGYGVWRRVVEDYHGIKVFHVPLMPRGDGSKVRLFLNYLTYVLSGCLLGPLWCREPIDLILVFENSPVSVGLPALFLKKIRRIPVLFWVQDLWPESLSATGGVRSEMLLNLVGRLVRLIYRGSDLILAQSRAFFPSIRKYGGEAEKIVYFPNSADEFYQPVTVEAGAPERALLPRGFRVMFAGNIGAAQDFETIMAAMARLQEHPEIHLVVVGDGRMRPWAEGLAREQGLNGNVHFIGRHPPEAMPRFFALADALLVTLRKESIFALTIPSKVQAYLACGRPVIAALDGEGARVVQEAGAGLTGPAGDAEVLAVNILTMYRQSKSQRRDMGLRGRAYFEAHFEREMLLDRLEAMMRGVQRILPNSQ